MVIYLNNKLYEIPSSKSISEIISKEFNIQHSKGIAIAVNQEVISKANWDNFIINENDKITMIKATQGG